jgi:hypothetical protein
MMNRIRIPIFAGVLAILCAFANVALADVVHLKNGGRIEGKIKDQGESWLVTHRFGSISVPKKNVVRIEKKKTLAEEYALKRKAADLKDPNALLGLGKWCREKGWEAQARKDFKAALKLDAKHRGAHAALGHVFHEGKWRTEAEIMEMRGFVRHLGKWVTRKEVARLKALEERRQLKKAEEKERRALRRKLRGWIHHVAYGTQKQCDKAYDEAVTFARAHDNDKFEKYLGDVKAWFDSYWKTARDIQKGTFEIRATMSNLKRPIPTIQTGLGGGTTPVRIQLPELSIVSVKTTVVIPLGRGK